MRHGRIHHEAQKHREETWADHDVTSGGFCHFSYKSPAALRILHSRCRSSIPTANARRPVARFSGQSSPASSASELAQLNRNSVEKHRMKYRALFNTLLEEDIHV